MRNEAVVAILDDDLFAGESLEFVIDIEGLTARRFLAADEFLDYMKQCRPQCVLLDMKLPGTDGIEVQSRLREMGSTVPVIIVSGATDVATATAALNNGAAEFIPKPIDPPRLLRAIRETMGGKRRKTRRKSRNCSLK